VRVVGVNKVDAGGYLNSVGSDAERVSSVITTGDEQQHTDENRESQQNVLDDIGNGINTQEHLDEENRNLHNVNEMFDAAQCADSRFVKDGKLVCVCLCVCV
jgi:hypothetical protein